MTFGTRLQHAWNAFKNKDPTATGGMKVGPYYNYNPDHKRLRMGNEKTIIAAIYTRIAIDVAALEVKHVRVDENGRYLEEIKDGLNECLTMSANIDQSGRAFIFDVAMSLFDEGVVGIVPVETDDRSPLESGSYDIKQMRVAKILDWYPEYVRVSCYNQLKGTQEQIILPKKMVAIVENPFYYVMNESNSVVRRLIEKMNQLDMVDRAAVSGKMDLIIQLPYLVKNPMKKAAAEERRKEVEMQLTQSTYGVAYIDGTERVTQLNRPAENTFQQQIEYLTKMVYSQLGISEEVFAGTADEQVMTNYYNRAVEPVISAICDAMTRTFITKTGRTQGQMVMFYRDPFKLVPASAVAENADKLTRNEILSPNDLRSILGYKPSKDPRADELRNRNLNADNDQLPEELPDDTVEEETSTP